MLKTEDLKAEIRRLCKEKDAIILAHYYTIGDIQDIADFVGDSLALARKAAETDAKVMVMCGVHFMAETCKLLSPDKVVLCPDLEAGCSLADSCKAEDLKKFKDEHPGYQVISYVIIRRWWVTTAHSLANPSTCSASRLKNDLGIKSGK